MNIKVYKNNNFWVNSDNDFITLHYFETLKNQFETLFNAKVDFVNFDVIKVLVEEVDFTTIYINYNNMDLFYYFDYVDKIVNNGVIAIFRLDVKLTYLIPFLKNWKDSNIKLLITRNNNYSLNSLLYDDPLLKNINLKYTNFNNFKGYQSEKITLPNTSIESKNFLGQTSIFKSKLAIHLIKYINIDIKPNTSFRTDDVEKVLSSIVKLNNNNLVFNDGVLLNTTNSNPFNFKGWIIEPESVLTIYYNNFNYHYAVFSLDFFPINEITNINIASGIIRLEASVKTHISVDENTNYKDDKLSIMVAIPIFSDNVWSKDDELDLFFANSKQGIQYLINNFKSKFIGIYRWNSLKEDKLYTANLILNNSNKENINIIFKIININEYDNITKNDLSQARFIKNDVTDNLITNYSKGIIQNLTKDYEKYNILWLNYLPVYLNKQQIKLADFRLSTNFKKFFNNGFYLSYSPSYKKRVESTIFNYSLQLPSISDTFVEWNKNINISKNAINTKTILSSITGFLSYLPFGKFGAVAGANNTFNTMLDNYVYNERLKTTGAFISDEYNSGDNLDIVNDIESYGASYVLSVPNLFRTTIIQLNNVLYYFGNINPLYLTYEQYFNTSRPFYFATFDPVNLDLYITKLKDPKMPHRYLQQIKTMLINGIRLWNQNIEI